MTQFGTATSYGDHSLYTSAWPRYSIRNTGTPDRLAQGPVDRSGDFGRKFGSYHHGVCQFVFADGHVQAIGTNCDPNTCACCRALPMAACLPATDERRHPSYGPLAGQAQYIGSLKFRAG
ncbi:MAG: DUF1559 domain-containing protein [Gemmataceae bacterium]